MIWTDRQVRNHRDAAIILGEIIRLSILYIKNHQDNVSELEVSQYILELFTKNKLVNDGDQPIVAFGSNTSFVHHFPSFENKKLLEQNNLILIDIWARKRERNSPYADITWMAYCGEKVPEECEKTFEIVVNARDKALNYTKRLIMDGTMPSGKAVDDQVWGVFREQKVAENYLHTTGHSLGFHSPHGTEPGINQKNNDRLSFGLGYTIEPGLYFKDKFGFRSEIDFYINHKMEMIVTTPMQEKIIHIRN